MAKKIAVIGDVMLDKYRYCSTRENPEHKSAPCWLVQRKEYKPGGAGNAAANLASLEANFKLISVVGNDHYSKILEDVLRDFNVPCEFIRDPKRQTIVKERIFVNNKYMGRIDDEKVGYIEENHVQEILDKIKDASLILISDYRKGMISSRLMDELRAQNIPILVDAKPEHTDFYKNVFLIKPNSKEIREMTGIKDELEAGEALMKKLNSNVLLTRGSKGINYFGLNGERYYFPAEKVKEIDVTGAGDTAIATFAHFFNKDMNIKESIKLANIAAGIAVTYPGCHQVTEKEIFDLSNGMSK
jgi:rfaE bifunctional protein kinase chain/domain